VGKTTVLTDKIYLLTGCVVEWNHFQLASNTQWHPEAEQHSTTWT